jgi:catechol 2,3-dioxygenase-like lactoylglutathione lyase family enzyme
MYHAAWHVDAHLARRGDPTHAVFTVIRGIHHTGISTGNLDRLVAFYRDIVGFRVVHEDGWAPGTAQTNAIMGLPDTAARVVLMTAGNAMLELFEFTLPEPRSSEVERPVCDHGITHLCLDVTDIDAEYARMRDAGMRFHCPPVDYGAWRTTYGRDPDGNVVEIQEVLDPNHPVALRLE